MSLQRTDLIVALVMGALGGAGGGYLAGKSAVHDRATPAVTVKPDDRELSERIATLEAEVTQLRQQRRSQPRAQAETAPAAQPAAADTPRGRALVDDPVFEGAVRDVMEKMQQERAGEREERRAQAMQRWGDRLAEKMELSDAQKTKVVAVGQDYMDKLRELRDSDAGPASPQEWIAKRDALRAQSEQRLGEVLSAHQMEIYKSSDDLHLEAGFGRGGRGRGQF